MIPESQLENVVASLHKHLADNYSLTAIQWPRTEFDSNNVLEWIRPDMFVTEGAYYRQTGFGREGKDLVILFNISIFGRREYIQANSYRLFRIRDTLRDLFKETTDIPVNDWVSGSETPDLIGALRCYAVTTDEDLGEDSGAGVFQRNLSFDVRWLEQWMVP